MSQDTPEGAGAVPGISVPLGSNVADPGVEGIAGVLPPAPAPALLVVGVAPATVAGEVIAPVVFTPTVINCIKLLRAPAASAKVTKGISKSQRQAFCGTGDEAIETSTKSIINAF